MSGRALIAIVGATAIGKTVLAVRLARSLDAEIVNADARQVYRRMDIGTAKPAPAELAAARHHLIDIVDPDEAFSLERWLELAQAALDDIWSRGKQPLLVGGTGQYVWALLEGWRVPRVPPDPELRRELESRTAEELLDELRRVDPETALRIEPRNARRLVRALEVQRATGKPLSFWRTKAPPGFDSLIIGLRLPRAELYRRIDERVEAMVRAGLIDEVRALLAMGYSPELPSMSGIGYREMCEHVQLEADSPPAKAGEIGLEQTAERIKLATHRFARHQNSWFKQSDPRIHWLEAGDGAAAAAERLLERELGDRKALAHER